LCQIFGSPCRYLQMIYKHLQLTNCINYISVLHAAADICNCIAYLQKNWIYLKSVADICKCGLNHFNVKTACHTLVQPKIHWTQMQLGTQRVQACTRWHFAFALQHPRSMDEMERRTQQPRRCYRRRGESVFASMRSACGMQWAWRITAGLCHAFPSCCHNNATHAPIANPPNSAQLGASLPLRQVTSGSVQ